MQQYQIEYNQLLKRYYDGCNYISNHLKEYDVYIEEVFKIRRKLCKIIKKHPEMTSLEITDGFKE